ncbi:hypothetical protein P3T76_006680 [Phytophthora citrophthora]|uniref:DUF1697 domain-containing protein n=1 Tax=Phytophthora citrophthora TaxID=4793 RepID=A0AAD9LMN4_9STRA|nr:hypothetical protein P3T76_006680 [Phytophthora citrophthora]
MTKGKRKADTPSSSSPRAKRITRSNNSKSSAAATAESVALGSSVDCRKIVAFLRGVNVGGRVHSMKSIAEALRKTGFHNVETFLASGNVIFDAPANPKGDASTVLTVEHQVEEALEKLFGCHIPVIARYLGDVAALSEQAVKTATSVNVVLVKEELTKEQRDIVSALSTDADELELLDKAFVWYSATKMSESPLFKVAFDKKLGVPYTVRTVNTLRRIVAKFG